MSVWLPGRSILPRPDLDSLRDGRVVLEPPDFSGASPDPFPASHRRGDTAEVRRSLDQAAGEELEAIVVIAGGDDPKFHVWVAAKTSKPSLPVFYSDEKIDPGARYMLICVSECADIPGRDPSFYMDTAEDSYVALTKH